MKRSMLLVLAFCMGLAQSSQALSRHVFYDFDNLSLGGFIIDSEGDWLKGELLSNDKLEGLKDGKGSVEVRAHLKPKQALRFYKGFQTSDLSPIKSMTFWVKAIKPGLKVNFFAMTNEWKWAQDSVVELKPGIWTEVSVKFSTITGYVPDKVNAIGLMFSAWDGYEGSVYVDSIDYFSDSLYDRDRARARTSGFENLKKTQAVAVQVDGAVAHGVAQKGLISFNIGDPVYGNIFASEALRQAGPGYVRMWSFGGYKNTINFNPAENKYEWEYMDREVRHLRSLGWEPIFCLGEPQKWNQDPKRYMPKDFAKWAKMAADTVKHYNVDLKWGLRYWEIWNEHDIDFWGGTEEEYLKLLAIACKKMKAVDPNIHIYAGAWANPGMVKKIGGAMLDKVPPKGLYDGITWHNYIISSIAPDEKIMSLTPLVEVPAHNAWTILHERGLDTTMDYGMSEANIDPAAHTDWRHEGMLEGVYWASELYHFILQNCSLAVHFTFNGDDNYAAVTDKAKPAYQSVLLFSKYAKVVGKQWLSTGYPAAMSNFETLALADEKSLSLIAINKDTKGTAFKASYELSNLPDIKSLHAWGIRDKQLEVTDLGVVPVVRGRINRTFPPYSVTVLSGDFVEPRKLAPVTRADPSPAALGLAVLGQYSWNGKPAVIGKGSSADAAPVLHFDGADPAKVVGMKLKSRTDLAVDLRMARDEKDLYISAVVKQGRPPVNNKDMSQLWNGDGIELDISSRTDLATKSRLKKADGDYQIVMTPTSADGKPAITCYNAGFKNMQVSSVSGPDGYTLTARIPLANFEGLNWEAGKKIRFDVAVAKAGADNNRASKLFWNATSDAWDSPDEWGLAEIQ